ncbi:MAG: DUF1566 domain-containing protein [Myxococcaceae bacterium]|nr:DUF1566 domain-containing protein [Myxococcaceae bacterium]
MKLLHAAGLGVVLGFAASDCGPANAGNCDADGVCNSSCAADVDCENAKVKSLCEGAATRLVEPGDGTVLDCTTTWSWEQTPPAQLLTWANALTRCDGLDFAGKSDWQLPTREQLESLLLGAPGTGGAWGGAGCRADAKLGGQCTWYWSATESSTLSADGKPQAWGVNFQATNGGPVTMHRTNVNGVRCVRNVPALPSGAGGGAAGGATGGGASGGGTAGCTKNSDCPSPKICESRACVYECTTDDDCSSIRRCSNHVCETFSCGSCQRVSDHRCVNCGSGPYGCYC